MKSRQNEVLRILMTRDGMSESEAREVIADVREAMDEAIAEGDYFEAEEIFESELGLEPDYIFDIM